MPERYPDAAEYPHETLIRLFSVFILAPIILIIIIPFVIAIGLRIVSDIHLAMPRRRRPKFSIFAKRRWG